MPLTRFPPASPAGTAAGAAPPLMGFVRGGVGWWGREGRGARAAEGTARGSDPGLGEA